MKKLFTLAVMLLATVWTSLNAADKQNILNKILIYIQSDL